MTTPIIQKSIGGSTLTVKSGGYLKIESGASLQVDSGGTFVPTGTITLQTAGSLTVPVGAELSLKPTATTVNSVTALFKAGANTFYYGGSGASPFFTASPGDLLWLARSASTALYVNLSDGTTGSRWVALNRTDAGSQIPG